VDSDFLTIKALLDEHALGTVHRFEMRWDRFRPKVQQRWRETDMAGAGILYDLGSHMFDQALQFFGLPEWLQADVFTQREGGVSDDGFEILMGKGALRIVLGSSAFAAGHDFRYRIFGDKATFVKTGLDVQEAQLRAGVSPTSSKFGAEPEIQHGVLMHTQGRQTTVPAQAGRWPDFYKGMKRAIETGVKVPVAARSARTVVNLTEAARKSAQLQKRMILNEQKGCFY